MKFLRSRFQKLKGKEGFTLVELMVVLLILSILVGIAIMKMQGTDEGAILASMESDARNAITAMNTYYLAYRQYKDVTVDNSAGTEAIEKEIASGSNIKLVASPGNKVTVTSKSCTDGSPGFTLEVTNSKLSTKKVTYDSCSDAGVKITDTGSSP